MGGLTQEGHKRFKATQADYDFVRAQSADTCLFCLSKQQVALLLASLEMAKWQTRWFSPSNAVLDKDWIEAFVSDLELELMTDHCNLEAAITEIQNNITTINENVTTINASLTVINEDITTINNNVTTINNNVLTIETNVQNVLINNNTTNYYFTINNYFSWVVNSQDNSANKVYARYNAFCQGILDWIYAEFYKVMSGKDADSAVLGAVLALMSSATSILYGLVDHGGDYSVGVMFDAIDSEPDVFAVACHMITYLKDLPHTNEAFQEALVGFTPANFNQVVIAETLQIALAFYDAFAAFLANEPIEYDLALSANPTGYDCPPCLIDPTDWCTIPNSWDFTVPELVPWQINRGALTVGQGILGTAVPTDTLNYSFDVRIPILASGCTFTNPNKINFYVRATPGFNNQFVFHFFTSPSQVTPTVVSRPTDGTEQVHSFTLDGTYYKYLRAFIVTNGIYYDLGSTLTAQFSKLSKVTLTAS